MKELKAYDIDMSNQSVGMVIRACYDDATLGQDGALILPALCVPPQGTGSNERVGRKITIKSIDIRGQITGGFATSYSVDQNQNLWNGQLRIIVMVDKTPNAAGSTESVQTAAAYQVAANVAGWANQAGAPTTTDLYETHDITAPRNLSNTGRYYVLKEKVINWDNNADYMTASTANFQPTAKKAFHININRTIESTFADTASTEAPADITANNILVCVLATQHGSNGGRCLDGPHFNFYSRVRYTDE